MDAQLKDKTALVTGASAGIGRACAKALALEGVQVAVVARRGEWTPVRLAEAVGRGRAFTVAGDGPIRVRVGDVDRLAGDVCRVVRCKEDGHRCEFRRRLPATER